MTEFNAKLMVTLENMQAEIDRLTKALETATVVARDATTERVRNAYELAAQVAERDVDWSAFGKRDLEQWEGGPDAARDYRLGIRVGRAIAAAIRAIKEGRG